MKDKIFECIEEFEIAKWDNDRDCFSDELVVIEKGSVWESTGYGYICGGEIRLEGIDNAQWLELSSESLEKYFKEV